MRDKVNRASRRVWAETARRLLNCKRRSRKMWGLMCFGKNEAEDRLNQNITRRGGAPCNDPARSVLCGGGFHRKRDFSLYNMLAARGCKTDFKTRDGVFLFSQGICLVSFLGLREGRVFCREEHIESDGYIKTSKNSETSKCICALWF